MIKYIKIPFLLFMHLILLQTGCTSLATLPTHERAAQTQISITSVVLGPTETATSSQTVTPMWTSTPVFTPTSTMQPFRPHFPLPTVALVPSQGKSLYEYLNKLLATNGGCVLPCVVGIRPGQTPWEEAQGFLDLLGKPAPRPFPYPEYELKAFNYAFQLSESEQQLTDWAIQFYVKGNEIQLLGFSMSSDFKNPAFATHYSLKAVLSALGEPTELRVSIYIPSSPKVAIRYFLNIYYRIDDLWLVFQYDGIAERLNSEIIEFCPVNSHYEEQLPAVVSILIQTGDQLYSSKDFRNLGLLPPTGVGFNSATGEDVSTFYKKAMASNGQVCFTSKVSFWGVMLGGDKVVTSTPSR